MLTVAEARARAEKGAVLFDTLAGFQDWPSRILATTLDMADCGRCAASHITGLRYDIAMLALGLDFQETVDHGFDLPRLRTLVELSNTIAERDEEWLILRNAWIDVATARLAPPALAVPNLAELLGVA